MAYDFCVGKSDKVKDQPFLVGSLEYDQMPALFSLAKRSDSSFIHRTCNCFDDASYSPAELAVAQAELLELMTLELDTREQAVLHKLIAII